MWEFIAGCLSRVSCKYCYLSQTDSFVKKERGFRMLRGIIKNMNPVVSSYIRKHMCINSKIIHRFLELLSFVTLERQVRHFSLNIFISKSLNWSSKREIFFDSTEKFLRMTLHEQQYYGFSDDLPGKMTFIRN